MFIGPTKLIILEQQPCHTQKLAGDLKLGDAKTV